MTRYLGRISKLKEAIDTLTVINKALITFQQEGIITYDQTLTDEIQKARQKLEELKKAK